MTHIIIRTASGDNVYATGLLGDIYETGVGETADLTLELPSRDLEVTNTYTVSGVESYDTITVPSGTTLTVESGAVLTGSLLDVDGTVDNNGTIKIFQNSIARLLEFDEYSGNYSTIKMLNGRLRYSERLPDAADIESLVVGIEPSDGLQREDVIGVWGLVENVTDARNPALTNSRVELTIRILARLDDYASVAEVETNLSA